MSTLFITILLFTGILSFAQPNAQQPLQGEAQPFWKKNAAVYCKIKEEKEIIVSATTEEVELPTLPVSSAKKRDGHRLHVVTAGQIHTPFSFTKKNIMDFSSYKKMSSHFEEVIFNAEKKTLFVKSSAVGYVAEMTLQLKLEEHEGLYKMHWQVVKGSFLGMQGVIVLEDVGSQKTEISMDATYEAEKIPLPSALMGFGLEVVGREVAKLMRNYIEEEFKKQ